MEVPVLDNNHPEPGPHERPALPEGLYLTPPFAADEIPMFVGNVWGVVDGADREVCRLERSDLCRRRAEYIAAALNAYTSALPEQNKPPPTRERTNEGGMRWDRVRAKR
jgi:hypothetical protein